MYRILAGLGKTIQRIQLTFNRKVGTDQNSVSDAEPLGADTLQTLISANGRLGRPSAFAIAVPAG